MREPLRLMCVLAHPDDESLGLGGILARYAAEGVATYLVTATRGERGWLGPEADYPGPEALGQTRESELRAAAKVLGLHEVSLLGYVDGELDRVDPAEAVAKIVAQLRRIRPQVVVTFDPYGSYGHPDHIAVCQYTTAALVAAADPTYGAEQPPHRASKLYYFVETREILDSYEAAFGELVMQVDGQERRAPGWAPWAITTRIDTEAYWQQVWEAIACHRSQLPGNEALGQLPAAEQKKLWGCQSFYRAMSLVNGGRAVEDDLFEGIR